MGSPAGSGSLFVDIAVHLFVVLCVAFSVLASLFVIASSILEE
jgi:hypothetical protein